MILYFIILLVTLITTSLLAWYSWQHRYNSKIVAILFTAQAALVLAELISLVSLTPTQALFWFKVRFVFIATLPVLWLVLALEFSDHNEWFSKRLLTALFAIPVITQVMIWTNDLHGLWLQKEVGFYPVGPFWIAEASQRIPGLWFLVHTFYSFVVVLTGLGLMIISAGQHRGVSRRQALCLAAAALIVLAAAMIPTFNLLPLVGFNLYTLGVELSAGLIAWVIFRYQFLQRAPTAQVRQPAISLGAREKRSLALFLFIFLLFVSGIMAIGYQYYQNYEMQYRTQVESQLSAITDLKVNELVNWRNERLGDALMIQQNVTFAGLVQDLLDQPDNLRAQTQLQSWLDNLRQAYQYESVFLLDADGIERISSPQNSKPVAPHILQEIDAVLRSRQITLLDFHRHNEGEPVYLGLMVPVISEQDSKPLGLLVLRIDPDTYLYPFIQLWPLPSDSAETLLVRREGGNVVFLNPLRFQQDAALNLSFPLEMNDLPAVKAVMGQEGIVEGKDYRGVPVIAGVGAIPDSPWFLVARMDAEEVYAPLQMRLWQTMFFFGGPIITLGVALVAIWWQQQMRFYRGYYGVAEALRTSQVLLQAAGQMAKIGGWEVDAQTQTVSWTEETYHIHEMPLEYQPSLEEAINFFHPDDRDELATAIQRSLECGHPHDLEARFITAKGNQLWTRTICKPEVVDGKVRRLLGAFQDVTERKQAEAELQAYSHRLEELVEERTQKLKETQEKLLRHERLAALGQLAGGVGHELRNPLGVIANAVYFLKMVFLEKEGKALEYLNIIEQESKNAEEIITDLLDFSRTESIDRRPVSVERLVRETVERYPAPQGIDISRDLAPGLPSVFVDPRQLERVLGNLITNAYQAMPDGGQLTIRCGPLTIGSSFPPSHLLLTISDTGVGIPPENLGKIFEPLFTTKARGIGLGLAISQKLLENNQASISVESMPGQGTMFKLNLPLGFVRE